MESNRNLRHLLKEHFGYDDFRPSQEAIISNALAGRNGLVVMPTGGGKSMCYQENGEPQVRASGWKKCGKCSRQ